MFMVTLKKFLKLCHELYLFIAIFDDLVNSDVGKVSMKKCGFLGKVCTLLASL